MNRKKITTLGGILFFALCLSTLAIAQQMAVAAISGRLTDPNGAAIAGAKIIAIQDSTAVERTTETNAEGIYILTNLPPGTYTVKAQASNFAETIIKSVVLQ